MDNSLANAPLPLTAKKIEPRSSGNESTSTCAEERIEEKEEEEEEEEEDEEGEDIISFELLGILETVSCAVAAEREWV